jgi:hypothetical protein
MINCAESLGCLENGVKPTRFAWWGAGGSRTTGSSCRRRSFVRAVVSAVLASNSFSRMIMQEHFIVALIS